jgi:3-deoxy-manno-octulosonate cytidylyltransferase (CMP-KDO synthetase)
MSASFTVVIPARYGSTRLPAKALAEIDGKPLVWHVVQRAMASDAEEVIVATDDERIVAAVNNSGCEAIMTSADHESGSDRLAEIVTKKSMPSDRIIVNVQGDEPTMPPRLINEVAEKLSGHQQAMMATAAKQISLVEELEDPNTVKVVMDQSDRALYFSRAPIPHNRDAVERVSAWHHIGIYAYRAGFLLEFANLPPTPLEQCEKLEQLRALENGHTIMVHKVDYETGIGVDTQADLERAREIMQARAW